MAKTKRREAMKAEGLEGMSDSDLQELRFFGNLIGRDLKAMFTTAEDQQQRAVEILQERGVIRAY